MDFENMMITPVIYQDIPSSFMMNPMPMMPLYGAYPYYGITPMKPVLNNDKFEKIEEKNKETRHTLKKTAIIGGIATAALIFLSKKFKVPGITLPKLGPKIQSGLSSLKSNGQKLYNSAKNGIINGFNKLKGIFKKNP